MANEWGFRVPSFTAQMSEAAPGAGGQGREEVNGAAEAPSRELAEQIGSKLGKNAILLMTAAESHSLSLGHRSIGTGDILWALFHEQDQVGSVAVRYLAQRGITRETVYSSHKYSDNAAAILKLAANRAILRSQSKTIGGGSHKREINNNSFQTRWLCDKPRLLWQMAAEKIA